MIARAKGLSAVALVAAAWSFPALAADEPSPAVSLEAAYVGDLMRNTQGGLGRGGAYLDNFDLMATVDGGQAFGVDGLTLHGHVMYNNGHAFSGRWVGDAQGISNIEGVDTWRLYEFWGELRFGASGRTTLRAGLYDLNSEFDSIETAGLFLNSSHGIGPDLAQTGENGPSIFPVTSLALRLQGAAATTGWYWQLAAFDAVPGEPGHPDRTSFRLGGGEGALLIGEFGRAVGPFRKLALGVGEFRADRSNRLAVARQPGRAKSVAYRLPRRRDAIGQLRPRGPLRRERSVGVERDEIGRFRRIRRRSPFYDCGQNLSPRIARLAQQFSELHADRLGPRMCRVCDAIAALEDIIEIERVRLEITASKLD